MQMFFLSFFFFVLFFFVMTEARKQFPSPVGKKNKKTTLPAGEKDKYPAATHCSGESVKQNCHWGLLALFPLDPLYCSTQQTKVMARCRAYHTKSSFCRKEEAAVFCFHRRSSTETKNTQKTLPVALEDVTLLGEEKAFDLHQPG